MSDRDSAIEMLRTRLIAVADSVELDGATGSRYFVENQPQAIDRTRG